MKTSTNRILTTHVGSLIRPQALQDIMRAKQGGQAFDQAAYEKCLKESVADVVRRQAEIGIDVSSDGEFGKAISWNQYVLERLSRLRAAPDPGGLSARHSGRRPHPLQGVLRRTRRARAAWPIRTWSPASGR